MSQLRAFNDRGRAVWGEWLIKLKEDPTQGVPEDLLANSDLTISVPCSEEAPLVEFQSKMELAQTLAPIIGKVRAARFPHHKWAGLWDWLAAFYFDSICPSSAAGIRTVKAFPLYKLDESWRRRYRHRILGPVTLLERLGPAAKILIHGEPWTLTDWEEQAASRYPIASNPGIAEALVRLYWDEQRGAPKRGASPNEKKPGTLRRFSDLVVQLDRTYDLLSVGSVGILPLLPREFDAFRDGTPRVSRRRMTGPTASV